MNGTTQSTMLERAIRAVAPQWALRRQAAREKIALLGAWKGASRTRAALAGWNPTGNASADDANRYELATLRDRSRDLMRSSPIAGGAIETVVTNVVGTGLSVTPTPDQAALGLSDEEAKAWTAATLREFCLWADSTYCDITRTQSFYGLQALAFRGALEGGDIFSVLPRVERPNFPYATTVQLVEAERVCNPGLAPDRGVMSSGVELDANGAPLAYHVANGYPGAVGFKSLAWTRVAAFGAASGRRNVLHLFERLRPGQTRGVPYLAAVIEPLKQLDRYTDAELQAAVVSGAFAVFVKMDAEAFGEVFGDSKDDYLSAAKNWDGSVPTGSLDGPGKAVNLLPGESIETANPGRPNALFDPFVTAILRQVGVRLGLPFEVLVKHFQSSYSAARAALLDAFRFFRCRREWLAAMFCQPVYETWLAEAVALQRVQAPGFFADPALRQAWSRAQWVGDGPGSIDPEKEVRAAQARVDLGISTREREAIMFDGVSWDEKHRQLVREEDARRRDGLTPAAAGTPSLPPVDEPAPARP